jgi:hypothetical protein
MGECRKSSGYKIIKDYIACAGCGREFSPDTPGYQVGELYVCDLCYRYAEKIMVQYPERKEKYDDRV